MTTLFFRNDDPDVFYQGDRRDELYRLTDLFIDKDVPLTQAIVPETVTDQTIEYFLRSDESGELLEFIQHGWNHSKYVTGEFDHSRSYEQQYHDIVRGKKRLQDILGDRFLMAFTAPYGVYTQHTLDILKHERFNAISSGTSFKPPRRRFDQIGRFLKRSFMFGKRISYHGAVCSTYDFVELSTAINIIKSYSPLTIYTKDELLEKINRAKHYTDDIGILLHHIFLNRNDCAMIGSLLDELKAQGFSFSKFSAICKRIQQ